MKQKEVQNKNLDKEASVFAQTYFHGTNANLKLGNFVTIGNKSNFGKQKEAKYIFLTSTLDAAIWAA